MCKRVMKMISLVVVAGLVLALSAGAARAELVFCCKADNDLLTVVAKTSTAVKRFDTPAKAISAASVGAGVLILADGYPAKLTPVLALSPCRIAAWVKVVMATSWPILIILCRRATKTTISTLHQGILSKLRRKAKSNLHPDFCSSHRKRYHPKYTRDSHGNTYLDLRR